MSAISRTDAARHVARANAVDVRRRTSSGSTTPENVQAPAAPASFDLEEDVARRVAQIGAEDTDRRRRIVRAFLESCVARTFGIAAPQDPAFGHVIEQVRDAIRADPDLAAAMERVVERLSAAAPPAP